MPLSADDARAIADDLLAAAKSIDAYLDANWGSMTRAEYEALNESQKTLLRLAFFATTEAVGLALDELQNPTAALRSVINAGREKIETLQTIGQVIQVAAGLADLAAGIMARNPGAVFKSARNLADTVEIDIL
tara:strand:- start:585 stop:983 length:399 start_codon:yes stop_codon:yes gene_type:complete